MSDILGALGKQNVSLTIYQQRQQTTLTIFWGLQGIKNDRVILEIDVH